VMIARQRIRKETLVDNKAMIEIRPVLIGLHGGTENQLVFQPAVKPRLMRPVSMQVKIVPVSAEPMEQWIDVVAELLEVLAE